ncbi:MAG: hypothetical protein R3174_14460 [Gammaproteobacteria bacterium]|nr:hypothetical protein [Gammaproteobacteria bacterium]
MDRRGFLSRAGRTGSVAMAAAVTGSAALGGEVRDKAKDSLGTLNEELRALRKRMDRLDSAYRKSFRAILVVTTVTTGVDLVTWM